MRRPSRSTRRGALRAAAATAIAATAGCVTLRARTDLAAAPEGFTSFALDAADGRWTGVEPDAIADERNPLLEMPPGASVDLTWTNRDGHRHAFVVEDSNGNRLVETDDLVERDSSTTVTFDAAREMTAYRDPYNPVTMRGDVLVTTR